MTARSQLRASKRTTAITMLWLAFAMVDAWQIVAQLRSQGMHHDWVKLFLLTTATYAPWALITEPILAVGVRVCGPRALVRTVVGHTFMFVTIAITYAAWTIFIDASTNPYGGSVPFDLAGQWAEIAWTSLVPSVILYCAIVVAGNAFHSKALPASDRSETVRARERLAGALANSLSADEP